MPCFVSARSFLGFLKKNLPNSIGLCQIHRWLEHERPSALLFKITINNAAHWVYKCT
jgi:hypothetical protein